MGINVNSFPLPYHKGGSLSLDYDSLSRLTYEGQFVAGARQYENYYEYH